MKLSLAAKQRGQGFQCVLLARVCIDFEVKITGKGEGRSGLKMNVHI